jgi:ribosomal protein S18 acetylase RimI-like enzyme
MDEAARRATSDDLDRLVALDAQLREELTPMRGGALWAARESRPGAARDEFAALLRRDDACVIVGTVDDYVVGFGTVELEALRDGTTIGRIIELFVEPDARGVGVGEAIAGALIGFCDERDCIGIDALALPGHRAAKNFFEASGFTARAIVMHRKRPQ